MGVEIHSCVIIRFECESTGVVRFDDENRMYRILAKANQRFVEATFSGDDDTPYSQFPINTHYRQSSLTTHFSSKASTLLKMKVTSKM